LPVPLPAPGAAAFDAASAFKAELSAFDAMEHEWALVNAEAAALKTLQQCLAQ